EPQPRLTRPTAPCSLDKRHPPATFMLIFRRPLSILPLATTATATATASKILTTPLPRYHLHHSHRRTFMQTRAQRTLYNMASALQKTVPPTPIPDLTSRKPLQTAAAIIIGDEVLNGKVGSHFRPLLAPADMNMAG